MHVGILTVPLRAKPLAEIIPWAAAQGIRALEIDVTPGSHFDAATVDDTALEQTQGLLAAHGMRISSLVSYRAFVGVESAQAAQARRILEQAIPLAERLGVTTVCTIAGFALPGKIARRRLPKICRQLSGHSSTWPGATVYALRWRTGLQPTSSISIIGGRCLMRCLTRISD